jgi:hypothetical protein
MSTRVTTRACRVGGVLLAGLGTFSLATAQIPTEGSGGANEEINAPEHEASTIAIVRHLPVPNLWFRLPASDTVTFHGLPVAKALGGRGTPMLYPAFGVAGLAAAVVTHGAIESSIRAREKSKQAEADDRVVEPFRSSVHQWSLASMYREALAAIDIGATLHVLDNTLRVTSSESGWAFDSTAQLLLTQDSRSLVVENHVVIRDARATPKSAPILDTTIEVVSDPQPGDSAAAAIYWQANECQALHTRAVALMQQSLDLALYQATNPSAANTEFKTWHYALGGEDQLERAQLQQDGPDRLQLKNLRGWILSVPKAQSPILQPALAAQ